MTTERHTIEVRGIPVEIVRKDIKNLHVGVYPPNGSVRVAVPRRLDDEAVRLAIVSRLGWIKRQQRGFQNQCRESQREMVTGESHFFEGRKYRLEVVKSTEPQGIRLKNNSAIVMSVAIGADRERRERMLLEWYRSDLKEKLPVLLRKWEPKIGVKVREIRIRKMKTRWGSCNKEAGRIWVNLELAKKPIACLEYILVHEMVHLLERHHSDKFVELMDTFLPQWRTSRDELNRAPLAYEEWKY